MKNIIIVGAARSGKTTLAKKINQDLGLSVVSVDAMITAFQEVFPELNIRHHGACRHLITPFAISYIKDLTNNYSDVGFVVESYHLQLKDISEKLDKNLFKTIVLGYPQLTPKEVFNNIRKFDRPSDYTHWMSDEDILNMAKRHVQSSQNFAKESKELGFDFVDTSYNREKVLIGLLDELKKYVAGSRLK